MPSQQEVKWSQLKVGTLVIVAIILLIFFLFLMTSGSGLGTFGRKLIAVVYFDNSQGIKVGAPVTLEGVAVGEVKAVHLSTDAARKRTPVQLLLKLNPKFQDRLHTDTRAALSTTGVIGDTVVELNSEAASGPELQDGNELKTFAMPSIATFMKSGQGTLDQLNSTIGKLDQVVQGLQAGKGSAGQLLTNSELYDQASATVKELHTLAANLNNGRGSAGRLLHDDTLFNHLNAAATNLDTITTNLNAGKGSAGKLLTDASLYNNLNQAATRTNGLLAQIDEGRGTVGVLFKDQAMGNHLSDTLTQLDTLLKGVNAGKGTVGQLVTNEAAYSNLNRLLTQTDSLIDAVHKDPKKYFVIRLKIF